MSKHRPTKSLARNTKTATSPARKPTARRWVGAALPPEAAAFFERYLGLPADLRAGVLADATHALSIAEDRALLAGLRQREGESAFEGDAEELFA